MHGSRLVPGGGYADIYLRGPSGIHLSLVSRSPSPPWLSNWLPFGSFARLHKRWQTSTLQEVDAGHRAVLRYNVRLLCMGVLRDLRRGSLPGIATTLRPVVSPCAGILCTVHLRPRLTYFML